MSVRSQGATINGYANSAIVLGNVVVDGIVVKKAEPTIPFYDGDLGYEITPGSSDIVLPTKGKAMKNDLVVLAVPYREEENAYGTTAVIG